MYLQCILWHTEEIRKRLACKTTHTLSYRMKAQTSLGESIVANQLPLLCCKVAVGDL